MYYEPKYFTPPEFFSKEIHKQQRDKGNQIWRLIDGRILWTADRIRERFCGVVRNSSLTMIINDWGWNGPNQYRGYRDIYIDIFNPGNEFSMTSQHCFGRAFDYSFSHVSAKEVIADIIANPNIEPYKYITGLETDTSWVHNDTRCWDKGANGLFIFKR